MSVYEYMNKKIVRYFWSGILTFWIPLILLAYSLKLVWPVVGKLSNPIARLLPFRNVVGEIADSVIGILIILLITLLIGWLVQKTVLKNWTKQIDKMLTKIFPNYSFYKNFISESPVDERDGWQSVIVKDDDEYKLGFIVDEKNGICTVYVPSAPNPYQGEIIFKKRESLQPSNISFTQAVAGMRRYGKGMEHIHQDFAEPIHENKETSDRN